MCHTCRGNLTLGLKSHAINVIFYVVLAYSGLYDSRYDYIGGGRFRPKLGLATNFSPYISSIHGHGMFSENVVWYAPHVHFRKILQPRSKNLRACQIYSCTAIKTPTAVGSYSCRIYSCRSEAAGRGAATATMPRPPPATVGGCLMRLVREDGGQTCPRGRGDGEE